MGCSPSSTSQQLYKSSQQEQESCITTNLEFDPSPESRKGRAYPTGRKAFEVNNPGSSSSSTRSLRHDSTSKILLAPQQKGGQSSQQQQQYVDQDNIPWQVCEQKYVY